MKTEGLWRPALMPCQRATDAREPRQRRPPGSCVDQPCRSGGWLFSEGWREPRRDPAEQKHFCNFVRNDDKNILTEKGRGTLLFCIPCPVGFSSAVTNCHHHTHTYAHNCLLWTCPPSSCDSRLHEELYFVLRRSATASRTGDT